jgi:hypothetical protein
MAIRKINWRIAKHGNKIHLGTYAEILELERKAKILE